MALIYRGVTIEDRKHEVILSRDKINEHEIVDIFTWCYDNFGGVEDGYCHWQWRFDFLYFCFRDEKHAMAFKLRWT